MGILRVDSEAACASAVPAGAGRTAVLIHGFKYDPSAPCADPNRTIYSRSPVSAPADRGGRFASWPLGLGFTSDSPDLCVGFGWRARAPHPARWLAERRTGFAAVYSAAGEAGGALAETLERLAAARSGPIDIYAHSLGARVALSALAGLAAARRGDLLARLGRLLLLAPAEFAGNAVDAVAAADGQGARRLEVYALLGRRNAVYDGLFEAAAPWGCGPSLGRTGLGARREGWIDLDVDHPELPAWALQRGVDLAPPAFGPCHWSVYTRPGAMALHRAILDREPGFGAEEMRASGAPVFACRPPRRWRAPRLPSLRPPLTPTAA